MEIFSLKDLICSFDEKLPSKFQLNSLIQCKRCIDDVFVFIRYLIMLSLREVLRIS